MNADSIIRALWSVLTALAILTAEIGSETGVLTSRGDPTILLCDPSACAEFVLLDGHIYSDPDPERPSR